MVLGRRDRSRARRPQTGRCASRSSWPAVERDRAGSGSARPTGSRRRRRSPGGARARTPSPSARTAVGRLRVHDAVALAHVRQRRGRPGATSNCSSSSAIATASTPPGDEVLARAVQHAGAPSAPPSSWIVCIGTMHSANSRPERRSRGHRRRRSHGQALPARRQLGDSSWSRSIAVTAMPGAGELERDAAGAGADVEHRAAVPLGQLAPQRQVLAVAAALQVVPDHVHARAARRRPERATWPRARRAPRGARATPCRSAARTAGRRRRGQRLVQRRWQLRHDLQALGGDAGVLEPQRQLGGARAGAGDAPHPAGQQLEVGVPDPRHVTAVGGAVVEDRRAGRAGRAPAPACAGSRWRRRGS